MRNISYRTLQNGGMLDIQKGGVRWIQATTYKITIYMVPPMVGNFISTETAYMDRDTTVFFGSISRALYGGRQVRDSFGSQEDIYTVRPKTYRGSPKVTLGPHIRSPEVKRWFAGDRWLDSL